MCKKRVVLPRVMEHANKKLKKYVQYMYVFTHKNKEACVIPSTPATFQQYASN